MAELWITMRAVEKKREKKRQERERIEARRAESEKRLKEHNKRLWDYATGRSQKY